MQVFAAFLFFKLDLSNHSLKSKNMIFSISMSAFLSPSWREPTICDALYNAASVANPLLGPAKQPDTDPMIAWGNLKVNL